MHLPPQDTVPVASLADGSATFFDGGPLGEVDVLTDGGPVFATAARSTPNSAVPLPRVRLPRPRQRVRLRREQQLHPPRPLPPEAGLRTRAVARRGAVAELRGRQRYYTVEYADAETLAGRRGPTADAAGRRAARGGWRARRPRRARRHALRRRRRRPRHPPRRAAAAAAAAAPPPPAHGSRCKPPPPLPPAAPPSPPPPPDDALAAPVVAGVAGVAGSSDSDGDARRATFRAPLGVAMAAGGVLYVADTGNPASLAPLGDDSAQAGGGGTTVVGRCGEPGSDGGLLQEPSAVLWDDCATSC